MLEELKLLVELQEIDADIHEIEKDKARLPRLVELAGDELREAEVGAAAAQAETDSVNKAKRDMDTELQAENEHLRKLKLRSTEIKTNKEYFAHLKEIEDCQKKISKVEESTLEIMEKAEKAEAALAGMMGSLEVERTKFAASKERLEKKFSVNDDKLHSLVNSRKELVARISKPSVEYYQQMLKLYPESAIVEAVGSSCTGCRMVIPPQIFNNVRKGEALVKCFNCRRILYFKEK